MRAHCPSACSSSTKSNAATLTNMVTTLRTELHGVREATDRFHAELKSKATQPLEGDCAAR